MELVFGNCLLLLQLSCCCSERRNCALGSDLGASVKGFKKAMSEDEPAANKEEAQKEKDADFVVKSIEEQQANATKTEEQKSQNKEQV